MNVGGRRLPLLFPGWRTRFVGARMGPGIDGRRLYRLRQRVRGAACVGLSIGDQRLCGSTGTLRRRLPPIAEIIRGRLAQKRQDHAFRNLGRACGGAHPNTEGMARHAKPHGRKSGRARRGVRHEIEGVGKFPRHHCCKIPVHLFQHFRAGQRPVGFGKYRHLLISLPFLLLPHPRLLPQSGASPALSKLLTPPPPAQAQRGAHCA